MSDMPQTHTCCDSNPQEVLQIERILGLCARGVGNDEQSCRLVAETDEFSSWENFADRAEFHGVAPLAYHHMSLVGALIPKQTWRTLMALSLRHRIACDVRTRLLVKILSEFASNDVDALILKGAALAYFAYPEPYLRPMKDIDLLVPKSQSQRAQKILIELGYQEDLNFKSVLPQGHHHLPLVARSENGIKISVEVHEQLFPQTRHYRTIVFEDLQRNSRKFFVASQTANTLGYEDMLLHVFRHAIGKPLLASPLRFIHIADLVTFVEKFSSSIDWERVEREFPRIISSLHQIHYLTPFSNTTLTHMPVRRSSRPVGIGDDYRGWPRQNLHYGKRGISWDVVQKTISPPEWWMRLYYGGEKSIDRILNRFFRHPFHLLEWVGHYARAHLLENSLKRMNLDETEIRAERD